MDFAFDEDQAAIADLIRDVLARQVPLGALADVVDGSAVDRGTWGLLGRDVGALALTLPEEVGGQNYGLVELAIVLQESGRAALPAPLRESLVALRALARLDTALAEKLLADGVMTTLVLGERELTLDEGTATGRIAHVPYAADSDVAVIAGETEWLVVELAGDGVTRTVEDALDPTRRLGTITLAQTPCHRIAATPDAVRLITAEAMLGLAAEMVGLADRCLALTVEHATTRQQFNRPIGSFQAVKHQASDMLVETELSRTAVYLAACRIEEEGAGQPDPVAFALEQARRAFVQAARTAGLVASATIQLHGGIGFTWEHPAHIFVKRLRASAHAFGGVSQQSGLVADERLAP